MAAVPAASRDTAVRVSRQAHVSSVPHRAVGAPHGTQSDWLGERTHLAPAGSTASMVAATAVEPHPTWCCLERLWRAGPLALRSKGGRCGFLLVSRGEFGGVVSGATAGKRGGEVLPSWGAHRAAGRADMKAYSPRIQQGGPWTRRVRETGGIELLGRCSTCARDALIFPIGMYS